MKIIIDAMGGDNAPNEIVDGALMAAKQLNHEIILVGDKNKIELPKCDNISLVHASEIIDCDDDPAMSIRSKKDSSIVVGLNMLANKQGAAFVSAGSTGAIVSGATLIAKRIKGIRRAAIGTVIPTKTGCTLLMDSGANADCNEEFLHQFAIMGNTYAKTVLKLDNPRIGLLNNGVEETKGNEVVKKTYQLLKETNMNFIGNVEAREVLNGATDVLITDGFSGNIFLKSLEGTAKYFSSALKTMLMKNMFTKMSALFLSDGIKQLKDSFDADKYGGAPVLGIDGVVIKAHGSSNALAIFNAVRQASMAVDENIVDIIKNNI